MNNQLRRVALSRRGAAGRHFSLSLLSRGNDGKMISPYYHSSATTSAQAEQSLNSCRSAYSSPFHNRNASSTSLSLSSSSSTLQLHKQEERLLIIGSGVAGCSAALTAAKAGIPVTIIHAGSTAVDCNSYWAQGGIIYRNYNLKTPSPLTSSAAAASTSTVTSTGASSFRPKIQSSV
jgi:hypothetical protein